MDAPGYREEREGPRAALCRRRVLRRPSRPLLPRGREADDGREGRERIFELVRSLTPEKVEADTRAALDAVADDPAASPGPKVCVGYCMGASSRCTPRRRSPSMVAARRRASRRAGHGRARLTPSRAAAGAAASSTIAFAEHDRTATPESVDRFREPSQTPACAARSERLPGTSTGSRSPTATSTTETRLSGTSRRRSTSGGARSRVVEHRHARLPLAGGRTEHPSDRAHLRRLEGARGSRSPTTCRRTRSTESVDLFRFIPGYETHIYNDNKEPLLFSFSRSSSPSRSRACTPASPAGAAGGAPRPAAYTYTTWSSA